MSGPDRAGLVSGDPDLSAVAGLLDDECARSILAATSNEPMSAKRLSERCDASKPTIYRRIERLEDAELLVEQTRPDPDGNHYSVYAANLKRVTVELADGEFSLRVEREGTDAADRLTSMWEGL
jgi:DNA-binding transcriptional ArsR family regulator